MIIRKISAIKRKGQARINSQFELIQHILEKGKS